MCTLFSGPFAGKENSRGHITNSKIIDGSWSKGPDQRGRFLG